MKDVIIFSSWDGSELFLKEQANVREPRPWSDGRWDSVPGTVFGLDV